MMKNKWHWVIVPCGFVFFAFLSASISAGIPPEQKQVFMRLIEEYMGYFNTRNADGILSMYADDAEIKTTIKGKETYLSKEQYKDILPEDIKKWEKKKRKMVDYRIEELKIVNDIANLEIEIRGKQGIFSGRIKGNLQLKQDGSTWKIIRDEI